MKKWYEELFQNFAESYETQEYTKGTIGEIDFIEKEINYNKSFKILDVGCGTGRHSIELAKRGYDVTGIDLSECMLERAIKKAKEVGVTVNFIKADARDLKFEKEFDLVIMICEGGFPLMETDEMNFKILESSSRALKANGKLIFTTLNGLFPLFHSVKDFINSNSSDGVSKDNTFDLMTFRDKSILEINDDNGNKKKIVCDERYYVPSEISWLLKTLGFKKIDIYGCKLGAFSRKDKLTTEDYEMLIIAEF
ncbi:MAG: bifunctional 3-demethylubiquinone-9 3-methyltransferase/ 2-octaprenyl-6-hydroxy phenol methylase [Candidatus Methanofastidiosum methylothiophilum]|uniref:Bifunctional 3-demethylubiquinone-9 3-methyltransferase/ 2-octaprenyl-6-hydroxy phenol methylase n=1 Tax=Candidatus Methanofastidiosum methylothiophilum TaxID=1705564 RepID=A0A150J6Z9_9EURY|nr:MAG: bifunctional 3-demethylubiquinone-9 3-methyltransferase/ 2-octaprenyl-6-hydroxy phenol methylase [Candidatus Methanofastidiosum methylthiophilus]NMC76398.1 class I SAM-dependent methyltransferase [Candidatus Methanofastidiosa archaeon]